MTSRKQSQRFSNRSASSGRSKEDYNFNETDRSILYEINNSMKEMKSEIIVLYNMVVQLCHVTHSSRMSYKVRSELLPRSTSD